MANPNPMDEAVLRARRRQEDEEVVARYAAGAGRGHDMGPMRKFVEKVRRDLGLQAVICDVEINGEPQNVSAWVVSYYFPGEEAPLTMGVPTRDVPDIPVDVIRTGSADREVEPGERAPGRLRAHSRAMPNAAAQPAPVAQGQVTQGQVTAPPP